MMQEEKKGKLAQRIKVDTERLYNLSLKMSELSLKLQDLMMQVQSVANDLDWEVASRQRINEDLSGIAKRMNTQCEKFDKYGKAVQTVCDTMTTVDNKISAKSKELRYMIDKIAVRATVLPKAVFTFGYPPQLPFLDLKPLQTADLTLIKHYSDIEKKEE